MNSIFWLRLRGIIKMPYTQLDELLIDTEAPKKQKDDYEMSQYNDDEEDEGYDTVTEEE